MQTTSSAFKLVSALALTLGTLAVAQAKMVQITVTSESLVAPDSVTFAPLNVAFHDGSLDTFNIGQAASAGIISVAELGAGTQWHADVAATAPTAVHGQVGGILLPGHTASQTFTIDTDKNAYFSFAGMVVPSNDFFIGNDYAKAYKLFDSTGHQQLSGFTVKANEIWDAGSEVFDPATAAFVVGGHAVLRNPQNSVVARNFAELAAFDGMTTAAGYQFHSGLTANQDVYRVSFNVAAVPEPEAYALMVAGLLTVGFLSRRRGVRA
ncbi:MAG: spondin domain-containing protein [Burkholderiales bacterium]|nr:spondin domain-containing protein [Burkholderiales bacterium]